MFHPSIHPSMTLMSSLILRQHIPSFLSFRHFLNYFYLHASTRPYHHIMSFFISSHPTCQLLFSTYLQLCQLLDVTKFNNFSEQLKVKSYFSVPKTTSVPFRMALGPFQLVWSPCQECRRNIWLSALCSLVYFSKIKAVLSQLIHVLILYRLDCCKSLLSAINPYHFFSCAFEGWCQDFYWSLLKHAWVWLQAA